MSTKPSGYIAFGLLPPEQRMRFGTLFEVAARKSIFSWQQVSLLETNVVVLGAATELPRLHPPPPCVIWVGWDSMKLIDQDIWLGRLKHDYSVGDLIDILDRAAVFLLDWYARQPAVQVDRVFLDKNFSERVSSAGVCWSTVYTHDIQNNARYSLRSWAILNASFGDPAYMKAMAILSRQPVTLQQLHVHSGLSIADLAKLLAELAYRNVLNVVDPSLNSMPSPTPIMNYGKKPSHRSLVRRLSDWLRTPNKQ